MNIAKEGWRIVRTDHDVLWLLVYNLTTKFGHFNDKNHAGFSFDEGKFSIVSKLSNRKYVNRFNDSFEFLLEYPNEHPNKYNHWLQRKDPLNDKQIIDVSKTATGYSPVHIDFSACGWGGLMKGTEANSLIDGNIGTGYWNYAIGDFYDDGSGKTPGPGGGHDVTKVYLWIRISSRNCFITFNQKRTFINKGILLFIALVS